MRVNVLPIISFWNTKDSRKIKHDGIYTADNDCFACDNFEQQIKKKTCLRHSYSYGMWKTSRQTCDQSTYIIEVESFEWVLNNQIDRSKVQHFPFDKDLSTVTNQSVIIR